MQYIFAYACVYKVSPKREKSWATCSVSRVAGVVIVLAPASPLPRAKTLERRELNPENGEIAVQVCLQKIGETELGGHRCGGSLLNEYTVLTAAHCLDYIVFNYNTFDSTIFDEYWIVAGIDILNGRPGEQKRLIDWVSIHPNYTKEQNGIVFYNDLAIIIVEKPFHFENHEYAKLPDDDVYPKGKAQVSGWGDNYNSNSLTATVFAIIGFIGIATYLTALGSHAVFSAFAAFTILAYFGQFVTLEGTLQVAEVALLSQEECDRIVICTEPLFGHGGALTADSGGPLVQDGVVIGVVSKSDKHLPLVIYTRVAAYRNWIDSHIFLPMNSTQ